MKKLKKYNKTFKFLMILGMFLNMLMPTGGMTVVADDSANDLGNIFTDVRMKNNNTIVDDSTIEIEELSQFSIELDWELNDEDLIVNGKWAEITLPPHYNLLEDKKIEMGPLTDKDDNKIGTYSFTKEVNGQIKVKVEFNEKLDNKVERSGNVWINFEFDLTEFEDNTNQ